MTHQVLIVDDEPAIRFTLSEVLGELEDITCLTASDGVEALEAIAEHSIDLVITDLKMPRMDGMSLLRELAARPDAPRVVVITAHGNERTAVEAMKLGAMDYFTKPLNAGAILGVVARALEMVHLLKENRSLRAQLTMGQGMVLASPHMFRIAEMVEKVARRNITVLIHGETGTGKELVAEALVKASPRANKPFIRFNCAALPRELAEAELFGHVRGAFTGANRDRRGLFREADGGTLLLDEINTLDTVTQGLLLRVLQERKVRPVGQDHPIPVDVRILASTNENLADKAGFRQDLYYRLNVVPIHLPPLRERREEIEPLARHFARFYGEQFGLGPVHVAQDMILKLQHASWPGNIRELEHLIQRQVALTTEPILTGDPFQSYQNTPAFKEPTLKEQVDALERKLIGEALERYGHNQSETARQLNISRITLINKMKKHNLR